MQIQHSLVLLSCLAVSLNSLSAQEEAVAERGPVRVDARPDYRPQDLGVGRIAPRASFVDMAGKAGELSEYAGKPLVIAVRDVGCPISKKYGPALSRLAKEYGEKGVAFLYLNLSEQDEPADIAGEIERFGFQGRYLHDTKQELGKKLGVRSTTEVFLFDAARSLRYRGAIDDQYGIGFTRDEPAHNFLQDAMNAVLAGDQVEVAASSAPGCVLDLAGPMVAANEITYHNRISRILQDNCLSCHRDAGVGPFALDSYKRARGRRSMMRFALQTDIMPPWFAGEGSRKFINDTHLNAADKEAILEWIADECPEGDEKDAPLARKWPGDWKLGEPDLALKIEPIEVPAEGTVEYKYRYVTNPLQEDRWVKSIEVISNQPQVVHHVLVFIEEPRQEGESNRDFQNRFQGGLFGYFGSMIPGQETTEYPEGMGKLLPAGASLKVQLHYTTNGEAALEQTTIGFNFMDEPPAHEMVTSSAYNFRFRIPPGDPSFKVSGKYRFEEDGVLYSFAPHMHLRGSAFSYKVKYPNGESEELLAVPRYDFNWQLRYRLEEPIPVPKGTTIEAIGWFDNSEDNLANPDPSAVVRFGDQTWEEMMIGYFEWYRRER
ncbi:MAG: redoxin family protein [Planctomycetota bacterium]|jgi:thiol-disulfide isomerase/thioredoxin